jgi:hypothetical protein
MRFPLVTAAYHREPPSSRNIPIPQRRQPHMSDPERLVVNGFIVKEDIDTFVAQTPKTHAGHDVAAASSTDRADISPPAAAVAHAVTLPANNCAVSHISLSTRRTGSLESRYD